MMRTMAYWVLYVLQSFAETVLAIGGCTYVWRYKDNIENLNDNVEGLVAAVVKVESRNIHPLIQPWIEEVGEIRNKADEVLRRANEVNKGCIKGRLNVIQRGLLSREASKLSELAYSHRRKDPTDYRFLPYELPSVDNSEHLAFRKSSLDKILYYLMSYHDNIIGVFGEPGVGKTWLVNTVRSIVISEKLFDVVAVVTVTYSEFERSPILENIQRDIAFQLGLQLDETNLIGGAQMICNRLTDGARYLIILDDVEERVQYDQVGITFRQDMRWLKIIVISNNEYAQGILQPYKYVLVEPLPPDEAWSLFRRTAGECVETNELRSTAQDILNKCGGLPSKIVYAGKLLRDLDPRDWHHRKGARDYLHELAAIITHPDIGNLLRDCHSKNEYSWNDVGDYFDELPAEITNPEIIQLASRSIILLNCQPKSRELLMLCSLFPENATITVEKLIRYAKGLQLFDDIVNMEGTRVRVKELLKELKHCSLLVLEYGKTQKRFVKMTEGVRDACLFVASDKKHSRKYTEHRFIVKHQSELNAWPNNNELELCTAISLGVFSDEQMHQLPNILHYPKLQILQLLFDTKLLSIPRSFFDKMKEVRVLEFNQLSRPVKFLQVDALPQVPESLQNLRTLLLENCEFSGEGLLMIGSLKNLEVLSFFSSKLDELPPQISQLTNLKLLDLRTADSLKFIPSGVISALKKLEELYMGNYDYWGLGYDGQSGERMGISISELSTLSLLKAVQVLVRDPKHLLQWKGEVWFQKLENFKIAATQKRLRLREEFKIGKKLTFEGADWSSLLDANISLLLRNTKGLKLKAVTSLKNPFSVCANLKTLKLFDCHDIKFLMETKGSVVGACNCLKHVEFRSMEGLEAICNVDLPGYSFHQLETVKLDCLPRLTHFWRAPVVFGSLLNLRVFIMNNCRAITGIFSQAVADSLERLSYLAIGNCEMLEGIVLKNVVGDAATTGIYFRDLTTLWLENLPNFGSFYPEKAGDRKTQGCGLFTQMQSAAGSEYDDASTTQSLFNYRVSLRCLNKLTVRCMNNLKEIVDRQTRGYSVPSLEVMHVEGCEKLLNLAASDSIGDLNSLKQVTVMNCESLEAMFDFRGVKVQDEGADSLLSKLEIVCLHNLKSLMYVWQLVPERIQGFESLKSLEISGCCRLKYVISSSVAKTLQNLQHLLLKDLAMIEEVIENEGGCSELTDTIVLPNFCVLQLENLDSLRSFSSGNHNFDFPQLQYVLITECPRMKTFCRGQLTAQKLKQIKVGYNDGQFLWKGDLNTTIHDLNRVKLVSEEIGED